MAKNFALIGAAGFVAPRHLKAIHDTGNTLIAAADPKDSVGVLDRYFPEARFFTEFERFDRFLEKQRRRGDDGQVHYVSVCSPNYLHDAHCRLALRVKADAICEKPLVISPWNIDQLAELEAETGGRVWNVLQLRLHDAVRELRDRYDAERFDGRAEVVLTYVTRRGPWYLQSWKGSVEKSGGVALNIGIHFFDMLLWLFGACHETEVHLNSPTRMAGRLELERARVRWFLSVDGSDLPPSVTQRGESAFRSITIDGEELDFTHGFTDLHTRTYEEVLAGRGFGLDAARPSIEVVYRTRTSELVKNPQEPHPLLAGKAITDL